METFDQTVLEEIKLGEDYEALSQTFSGIELLEIFPEARPYLRQKLGFLKKLHKDLQLRIMRELVRVYTLDWEDDFAKWFEEEKIKVFLGEDLIGLGKEIRKMKDLLYPLKEIKGRLTSEQIQRAKDRPLEELLEFNRAGFTKCFAHSEKTPSLHFQRKKNKIYCFGCGKSWDTISYLMETQGLDFKQAVTKLQ